MRHVVVVGGGMAGAHTVGALRDRGYAGRITLLGAEPHRPYDRPPLSKQVLTGAMDDPALPLDWDALDVDERLGTPALALGARVVQTAGGTIGFDALVIATGAEPVLLPGTDPAAGVHTLRTIDDALRLREALGTGARVVLIGAGWIGAEVATAAAARGCDVTVVEARPLPLAAALPSEVAAHTVPWYAEAGVDLRLRSPVERVERGGVVLAGGERLPADVVLVGVGVRPATGWLAGSGVERDARGLVLVDERLRTSLPGVYAVGDCTAFPSRLFGTRIHVEHWDNARLAPCTAAVNLLGGEEVYDPVPYFWSRQFRRMVQYAGQHTHGDAVVWRGEPASPSWAVLWLRDGRLTALLAVRRPRDLEPAMRLIRERAPVDPERLADPATPMGQ